MGSLAKSDKTKWLNMSVHVCMHAHTYILCYLGNFESILNIERTHHKMWQEDRWYGFTFAILFIFQNFTNENDFSIKKKNKYYFRTISKGYKGDLPIPLLWGRRSQRRIDVQMTLAPLNQTFLLTSRPTSGGSEVVGRGWGMCSLTQMPIGLGPGSVFL